MRVVSTARARAIWAKVEYTVLTASALSYSELYNLNAAAGRCARESLAMGFYKIDSITVQ